jgi:hypothetical protein
MTWAAVGTALSIGVSSGLSSNKKAREAAKLQSELTYEQRMEEIRRLKQEQDYALGANRAAAFASGVRLTGTSSTQRFLTQMQSDFARDIGFRRRAATLEKNAIRKGASGSNLATIASGVSSIGNSIINYNR